VNQGKRTEIDGFSLPARYNREDQPHNQAPAPATREDGTMTVRPDPEVKVKLTKKDLHLLFVRNSTAKPAVVGIARLRK
jgi:hypothetical protein